MGKITVVVAVLLAVPVAAAAQDFGIEWLDRVTHEREQERGPLKPRPVDAEGQFGVLGYIDNNVLLADKNGKTPGDFVAIPFLRGTLDYSEQRFEASADLMVNYVDYSDLIKDGHQVDLSSSRAWEERFFGHARYVDARWQAEVSQLIQDISDPVNVQFLTKAKRLVSDTTVQGNYDLTKSVALEAHLNYEVVKFNDRAFSVPDDNDNFRGDASIVYRQANGFDWLVQLGWTLIYYGQAQPQAPPDARGYYVHFGYRGEIDKRLAVEALVGWIAMDSDRFVTTQKHDSITTADIQLNIRYDVTEQFKLYADYGRTVTWAGGIDPYQLVNLFALIAEWECTEELKVRARVQVDNAETASHMHREYESLSLSASYKFSEHVLLDGGATYRTGKTNGAVLQSTQFDDTIVHLGLIFTF